ncbi:MAG: V-type ATPase subunit [Oscillospiraceae bacterium]
MQATATQALIPKVRGMYAKRIRPAEYEEMLRRRTVPEVAALLKRHPYFGDSLATLSTTDPHRGQIEELLEMDIFLKYERLMQYDFSGEAFSRYYLAECEMRQVLKALHLLSIGIPGAYLGQIPGYLAGKTRVDLFELGRAKNFAEVVQATRHTPYYKALKAREAADPLLCDFPMAEATLLHEGYARLFALAARSLRGREARAVRDLFLQQAEVYNLELLLRVKTYFPTVYAPAKIHALMLPYTFRLNRRRLEEMVQAKSPEAVLALLRAAGLSHYAGPADPDALGAEEGRATWQYARRMLHLAAAPMAALAAFLSLAGLIRDNVVNVIEGVRYGLPPEQIRGMLRQ